MRSGEIWRSWSGAGSAGHGRGGSCHEESRGAGGRPLNGSGGVLWIRLHMYNSS